MRETLSGRPNHLRTLAQRLPDWLYRQLPDRVRLPEGIMQRRRANIVIFCPDDESVLRSIIDAASEAGAGAYQEYTKVAFIQSQVIGNWQASENAHPYQGVAGVESRENCAIIGMTCPQKRKVIDRVVTAVIAVHPWEEPVIHVFPVKEYSRPNK